MKKYTLLLTILLCINSYCQTLRKDLYAFDFSINDRPIAENTKFLKDLGYKGVVFNVTNNSQLNKLNNYLATEEMQSGDLNIPVVYYGYNADNNVDQGNTPRWKSMMNAIPQETDFWVIINGDSATRQKILQVLSDMAAEAKSLNKDVVIYPHDKNFIEGIEDAVSYIKEIDADNLYATLHLCHELREGNKDRMEEVIQEVRPYIKHVSISGALNEISTNPPSGYWGDAILPLDESEYDLEEYVLSLANSGYNGEMFLHTFGITRPAEDHMSSSFTIWENLVDTANNQILNVIEHSVAEINMHPNPATNTVTFTVPKNLTGKIDLQIVNIAGQKIYQQTDIRKEQLNFDISDFSTGVYFVQLLHSNQSKTIKLLKK